MTISLLDHVLALTSFDPADSLRESLLPFTVGTVRAGWMRKSFAARLEGWPELFTVRPRGVGLLGDFDTPAHRSAALAEVVESLAEQEVIRGWRGEQISVSESFYREPLFHLERAATRHFGITAYAAHLNGLTVRDGQPYIWLSERSAAKFIDPGKWDVLAAGRIGRGETARDAMRREAFEEAGVPSETAALAKPAGAVRVQREVDEGLHREIAFVHDLILPTTFVPVNRDGEVASFRCVSMAEIIDMLRAPEQFTADAVLAIVDCLIRRGYFGTDRPDYLDLIHAIHP